jgi:hypothetical protein
VQRSECHGCMLTVDDFYMVRYRPHRHGTSKASDCHEQEQHGPPINRTATYPGAHPVTVNPPPGLHWMTVWAGACTSHPGVVLPSQSANLHKAAITYRCIVSKAGKACVLTACKHGVKFQRRKRELNALPMHRGMHQAYVGVILLDNSACS